MNFNALITLYSGAIMNSYEKKKKGLVMKVEFLQFTIGIFTK